MLPKLARRFAEHLYEEPPDGFALGFRLGDALQRRQKALDRVHRDQVHALFPAKDPHDLFRLAQSQQAVIDENAMQALADRALNQSRRYRRVDAAAQRQQDALAADLRADAFNGDINESGRRPFRLATADR